jgi:hypothetical protein
MYEDRYYPDVVCERREAAWQRKKKKIRASDAETSRKNPTSIASAAARRWSTGARRKEALCTRAARK